MVKLSMFARCMEVAFSCMRHLASEAEIKQRVLSSDAAASRALVNRMRRSEDPQRVAVLLDRLND